MSIRKLKRHGPACLGKGPWDNTQLGEMVYEPGITHVSTEEVIEVSSVAGSGGEMIFSSLVNIIDTTS
jgi:hypothetical protein